MQNNSGALAAAHIKWKKNNSSWNNFKSFTSIKSTFLNYYFFCFFKRVPFLFLLNPAIIINSLLKLSLHYRNQVYALFIFVFYNKWTYFCCNYLRKPIFHWGSKCISFYLLIYNFHTRFHKTSSVDPWALTEAGV